MATPAQAAAATVGAGSLAAAGAYGITQAVNGGEQETDTQEEDSKETPLLKPENPNTFTNSEASAAPYNGKLISFIKESNLSHLVKPTGDKAKEWWDWAFENFFNKKPDNLTLDPTFSSVRESYSSEAKGASEQQVSLNQACDAAYKKQKSDYSFLDSTHLLKNIKAFCTTDNSDISEPKVLVYTSKPSGYDNGLLNIDSNRNKLVKSKIENTEEQINHNDLWWNWAFKNLLTQEAKATATDSFKNLTVGYRKAADGDGQKSLNNACDDAYKKGYSDLKTTSPIPALLNDIKRFCSKDPSNTELILPEPSTHTNVGANSEFSTKYTTEKTLVQTNNNKTLLVDPDANQDWWTWSFTVNYPKDKTRLVEPFINVTEAYNTSKSDDSALNLACKTSYSKIYGNFQTEPADKDKLIDLIRKFCVPYSTTTALETPTQ